MSEKKIDQIIEVIAKIDKEVALQKAALEDHTDKDEKMYEELKRMNDILQKNTESLKEHMQNNMILKDMLGALNRRLEPIELEYIQKKAVRQWLLDTSKFLIKVGTAAGIIIGVYMYGLPFLVHLLK